MMIAKHKKLLFLVGLLFLIGGIFLLANISPVQAVDINNSYGNDIGYEDTPLEEQIINIVQWVLGFLALVAVIIIIYGGFLWLTSAGNAEQIDKAKKVILGALIGLVIVLLAWAIVWFIIQGLTNAANNGGGGDDNNNNNDDSGPPTSEFFVEWHDPGVGETEVSVCRPVQAKFNAPVEIGTLPDPPSLIVGVTGDYSFNSDNTLVQFRPSSNLEGGVSYNVKIPSTVESESGYSLDPPIDYLFTTSLEEDIEPPSVANWWPQGDEVCLAGPLSVEFSEPMDVLTFKADNISIEPLEPAGLAITNVTAVSENVMTFSTNVALSPDTDYTVTIKSSDLNPVDPIADACGNPLDGNDDGTAGDSFTWTFHTALDDSDCPPAITSMDSSGFYESIVTINGQNFTNIPQTVTFSDNVDANNNCFDGGFLPNAACIQEWSNEQIKIQVPADLGNSFGAVDGPVTVTVSGYTSDPADFDVKSPHISENNPNSGAPGQAITIMGNDFSGAEGSVYFRNLVTSTDILGEESACSTWWFDDHIIIRVPEGFNTSDTVMIQVERADGRRSNLMSFTITDTTPGPELCELNPVCGDVASEVILTGDGFGDGGAGDDVYFETTTADTPSWEPTSITAVVPDIADGDKDVYVQLDGAAASNALIYEVTCGSGGDDDNDDNNDDDNNDDNNDDNDDLPGTGDPCDSDIELIGCQPDNTMCTNPDELCRPDDCRCYEPPAYECSSEIWTCSVEETCPADSACNNSCLCKPVPTITDFSPVGGGVCRNASIEATFSVPMRQSSFTSQGTDPTFELYIDGGLGSDEVCTANSQCRSGLCNEVCVGDNVNGNIGFRNDSTTFSYRAGLLERNTNYAVYFKGGTEGVLSQDNIGMSGDVSWTFTTLDSENPCSITDVKIEPNYWYYRERDESVAYHAEAYYRDQVISPIPEYNWFWHPWVSVDPSIIAVTGSSTQDETGTTQNVNGETIIRATAEVDTPGPDLGLTVTGESRAKVDICENPWPDPDLFIETATNFSAWYCLDDGLPGFTEIINIPGPNEVIREVFFTGLKVCSGTSIDCSDEYGGGEAVCTELGLTCDTLTDVVGIRVMPNTERYSPALWYAETLPDEDPFTGTYSTTDGYQSIQIGRTRYVGGTNLDGTLWANMYLLSYNEGAKDFTKDIYDEIRRRWVINSNIDDDDLKNKLRRDMARMGWLNDLGHEVVDFYGRALQFPTLEVGSYLKYRSTSAWPSWQATLGNELGRSLRTDPLNTFQTGGTCHEPEFELDTCWHEEEYDGQFGDEGGEFECEGASNVLMYKYLVDTDQVGLYMNLEYTGGGSWAGGGGNPCSDTTYSNCGCFNYGNIIDPPTN